MSSPAAGIRLSFLPQVDQSRYENLFTQATSGRYMSSSTAKDVLSRSGLDNETLAKIWNLSSVTQDPQLSFPEFAVAMYLTSMRMTGRELPDALPISIRNEIETAVATVKSTDMNTPTINAQPTGMSSLAVPSPQQMMPTGATNISPQRSLSTSMLSSMSTGQSALPQQTGSTQQQQQQQQSQPQQPSFTGLQAPMMTGLQVPMTTGMSTNFQVPMITGVTPLMANNPQVPMPTGMHGNNLNFANMMMPGASSVGAGAQQQNFQTISGKVKIPWAVTIEEKQRYSKIFKAWDTEKKGYLSGEKAKEVFTQSGLPQNVLMQIWNLADPNNMGKLNIDEFCVAMHLIYRKLNGYDVPTTLPPELVPPSTRELKETVSELKNSILQDIATKRGLHNFSSSATLAPPNRGTVRARSVSPSRTSGSRREKYKDDDNEDAGYVSSARRMGPDRSRRGQNRDGSPSPTGSKSSTTSSYGYRGKATRISDLRKQIAEQKERMKQIEQEAIARKAKPYRDLSYTEQKDIDDIKEKIRELQNEIVKAGGDDANHLWDTYSKRTAELAELTEQEKSLESEVRYLIENSVRALVRQLQETEDDLAEKKKQHAKSKVTNDGQALDIVGTGPNGEVTEQDKIRAKAKAMVAARMGKLTGKTSTVDITAELDEIEQEKTTFKEYAESIAASLQEAEDSINSIHMEISMLGMDINKHQQDQKKIDERRRFETGENVAADLKEFIQQLSFEAAIARAPDVDPSFETRFPSFE